MDNAKWLEERRRGLGGSDIGAILGLSPWKSAFQVYQEKRGEVESFKGNDLTDWGKRMEPTIRQWYSDTTGHPVRVPDKILYHSKHPFMLASLDGFTDEPRGVEIKTARSGKEWGEPGTNEIPDDYMLQVQHYMAVTGFPVFDVPVSIAGAWPVIYEVPSDPELQEMIIDACADFWQRVIDGNPPEPTTYADAVQRFGKSEAQGVIVAGRADVQAVEDLREVKAKLDQLKAEEEDLKGRIIIALGDTGDTLADEAGSPLVTYRMSKGRKSFNSKLFQTDHPDLYASYESTGESSRKFLLK
jgi:putative phage-type endonuclease